jgi:hypothetical protein
MGSGLIKFALTGCAALGVAACAGILGIGDRSLEPAEGGTGCSDPCSLATGLNFPSAVAVDESNVYWAENGDTDGDGAIKSCPVTGCEGAPTLYASLQASPVGIAVDANNVYWATADAIEVCAIGGCGGQPTKLASAQSGIGIAVDATYVYWVEFAAQTVNRVPKAGGAASVLGTIGGALHADQLQACVVDSTSVYTNDQLSNVFSVPIAGGALTQLFDYSGSSEPSPWGLAEDSSALYIGTPGAILSASKTTPNTTTPLAADVVAPVALAVDPEGGVLYWADVGTEGADGTVGKVPLDGGAPVVLASSLWQPEAIAINSTYAFWVSIGTVGEDGSTVPNTGTLYRTSK